MAAFIDQIISQTGVPLLDQLMQFTSARHELLVNNIANIDTPGYQVQELSVKDFQQALGRAVKNRAGNGGQLVLKGEQVRTGADGRLIATPAADNGFSLLFHDQARRQVEREMAALAENTLAYNVAAELLRGQFESLKKAIRQRM